jgi:hypothetical protein
VTLFAFKRLLSNSCMFHVVDIANGEPFLKKPITFIAL